MYIGIHLYTNAPHVNDVNMTLPIIAALAAYLDPQSM